MLKKLTVFTFLAAAAAVAALPAHAQLGIAAGLNYNNFSDASDDAENGALENSSGYHVGAFYDLAFGPLGIRPGIFYRRVGDVEFDAAQLQDADLSSIDVPIDLRFRLGLPFLSPYVLAGPVISWPTSGDDGFGERLEDMVISANIGAGLEIGLPGIGFRLMPEILYAFGISNFVKEESVTIGGQGFEFDEQKANVFMVRLGLKF